MILLQIIKLKKVFGRCRKSCIFALVNQQYGLPLESAFSLYSDSVNFDNSLVVLGIRENEMLRRIIVYLYILLWSGSLHQILYTTGSRSPHTKRIGRWWMAPLSSLSWFTPPSREQMLMPMQYKERLNRIMGEILFEKSPIEPPKPEKPYIDERRARPKEGQQILTDSTKKIIVWH